MSRTIKTYIYCGTEHLRGDNATSFVHSIAHLYYNRVTDVMYEFFMDSSNRSPIRISPIKKPDGCYLTHKEWQESLGIDD